MCGADHCIVTHTTQNRYTSYHTHDSVSVYSDIVYSVLLHMHTLSHTVHTHIHTHTYIYTHIHTYTYTQCINTLCIHVYIHTHSL